MLTAPGSWVVTASIVAAVGPEFWMLATIVNRPRCGAT